MSRKAFALGGLFGGLYGPSLFLFSAMGEFASHEEAAAYFNAAPRNGRERAVTVETVPCVRSGVEYGIRYVVRDLRGRELNV